jgi:D-allose transport system substrate-binding protein
MLERTVSLAVVATTALWSAGAHAQDQKVYGVLLKTLSNPFWGAMEQGVQDGAEAAGVEYYLQAVESDQAAEPQLNVCLTMLERQPDVMITAAINSTNLLPCLKQATDSGIPVVDLDANLDHDIAAEAGVDIAFTIGSDNVAAGAQGAEYLVDQLGADASGPVLVIEGLSGNITGQRRAQGFADKLAELAPGLEIVASLAGDWDRAKAANITNDTLTRNPDLVAIFAANDTMALGAVDTSHPPWQAAPPQDGSPSRGSAT